MNSITAISADDLPRHSEFVGARFDQLDMHDILALLARQPMNGPFRYIVTPNVDHIVRLDKDPEIYSPLYNEAWLSVCDSRILQLLARKSGLDLPVIPGSDLTKALFESVIDPMEAVNVIGGDDEVIEAVRRKYGLRNLNSHMPPMGLKSKPEAIAACAGFIADHPARFTFICVGSPQQEIVAQAAMAHPDAKGIGLCVGASLDFIAGKQKRAPEWMQKNRLEWLYRLMSEPGRLWKRYLVDGPRIFKIWWDWRKDG